MGEKVAVGAMLAGKYRVEKVLGAGGMGVVVAARHEQLDVLVAIKFMADETLKDPDLVLRFLRAGRAVGRLRSEHVARVTDVGMLESGAPYRVIEYLEGRDLSALLSSERPQPIPSAVEYVVQACEALDEAHRAGIVHGDIKPSNLFLTTRPNGTSCLKVLDFGISTSALVDSSLAKLHATHSRAVQRSRLYMAPEQMQNAGGVDARADIWALGATLYELLTGRVPFEADSLAEHPVSLREIRAEIPPALEGIVLRCLEKHRDRRFASASMLASALAPFALRWKVALRGVAPRAEWSEDIPVDSSEDGETPVVQAPVPAAAVAESIPPPQEPAPPRTPALPRTSAPPRTPAPRPDRTRPSGGNALAPDAEKSSRKRSRAAWHATVIILLAASGVAVFLVLRSLKPPGTARESTPVGADLTAPTASDAATERSAAGPKPSLAPAQSTDPSGRIPTLSVTDLPTVPRPVFMPPPYRPAEPHLLSSVPTAVSAKLDCAQPYYIDERGHKRFKSECFDSPSVDAATAPRPQAPAQDTGPSPTASPSRATDQLAEPH